jgi:hypothetical protein
MQLARLLDLALMACLRIPLDILNNVRPPKAQAQAQANRIDSLVPKIIVCFFKDSVLLTGG